MNSKWWEKQGIDALDDEDNFNKRLAELAALSPSEKRRVYRNSIQEEKSRAGRHEQATKSIAEEQAVQRANAFAEAED